LIKSLIGVSPKYFRPPYSAYNILVDNIVKTFNYKTIMVGLDSQDYTFPNSTTIVVDTIKSSLTQAELTPGGPIICQHDLIQNSVNQVDSMIKNIKSQGYTIVSLDNCLA
jgi:peptidoglycan/xylan/chitin deacetylase (PgdA/CDA1 family)